MNSGTIFFLCVILSYFFFGWMAKAYLVPWAKKRPREQALTPLLVINGTRYAGLAFLVPGVVSTNLPQAFAKPAAYGDLLVAVLAMMALFALRKKWRFAIALVWLFNLVGAGDLVNAFYLGFVNRITPGSLSAMFFVPTVAVPAFFWVHLVIFWLLLRSSTKMEK